MATFVLVPGAGGQAAYWDRLCGELETCGHRTVAVQLPSGDDGAGWAAYADAIVDAGRGQDDVVLVAQSLGGFSAPLACERLRARLLVLLNAMIPLPGETGMDWWSSTGSGEAQASYFERAGLPADGMDNDHVVYFHDIPPDVLDELLRGPAAQQSMTPMYEPWPLDAWPDVPTVVLAGRDDRLFPAEFQRRVARERLDLEAEVIPGGHMAAMSHPVELAKRLDELCA